VDRVAVLVHDDLGVLGSVHPALAETDEVLLGDLEAVVDAELVDPQVLAVHVDRPQGRSEAERLEVLLGLVDPEAAHDLLEAVVRAAEDERVGRAVCRRARVGADVDPFAAEEARAVQVAQPCLVILPIATVCPSALYCNESFERVLSTLWPTRNG
jgi:hypothetical protein